MALGLDFSFFFQPVSTGEPTTYAGWLFSGFKLTLAVGLGGWIIALIVGSILGVLRTVPNKWLSGFATAYVELFRNIPLLIQLFFWYYVAPDFLPQSAKEFLFSLDPSNVSLITGVVGLGLFTAARVCEQVRSGINSLARGQKNAGLAVGLTLPQTYRYVLLPMAFRVVVPPLTSEFVNIFKNSAVISTVNLLELTGQGKQLVDYTAHSYESFIAVTLAYMLINVVVLLLMRFIESKARLPGYIGGK
ncbi:amino acid ABC transporter permease [Pandoraea terrae]|uniref:Amino acid ABC transporter permease n=1 Tax=Pandoraea terrae TaxID=1537710 RepID=A0A5E4TZ46_9BURK|nr:amino acid ABC transporter permease [Pandoraea terrae]VVD93130.1 amino acid ABC transporter permease [Pandoraea terrae]